jgi:threonine dehydrogenase-like Zn-dependent dehydrogenase
MHGVFFPGDKKVEIRELEKPTPGMGEVLIQMKASAICRSDMSLYYGTSVFEGTKTGLNIPGHEPAGEIVEVGEGVTNFKPGDRVAVYLALGCGECEYIAVPAENCMRIPDDMSYVTAAVSTDAVGTLFHAQKRLGISGRDVLVIFGMGPMGGAGVMIAKGLGATVIAVDMLESRLEMAKELGADYTLNGKEVNVQEEIARITKGRGADAAIDCSGNPYGENDALDRETAWPCGVYR